MMNKIAISCHLLLLCLRMIYTVEARNLPSSYSGYSSPESYSTYSSPESYSTYSSSRSYSTYSSTRGKGKGSKKSKSTSSSSKGKGGKGKGGTRGSKRDSSITRPTGNTRPTGTTRKSAGGGTPTAAPTPAGPSTDECVGRVTGTLNFDDLGEDEPLTIYECLVWTNWRASETSPPAPSLERALVPGTTDTTVDGVSSVESVNGSTFSLSSIFLAGRGENRPVEIRGFDASGVLIVSEVIDFNGQYEQYDLTGFTNVQRIDFIWTLSTSAEFSNFAPNVGTDNWVFV
eukprot:scaffold4468_cov129-Cylindrotheca_fusiformis.AAC.5